MVAITGIKADTIEKFLSIDSLVIHVNPSHVNSNYRLESNGAKQFISLDRIEDIIDTRKPSELITQTRALRKKHFWFLWGMYAPSRQVIKSTITVIQYCPSNVFLEGFYVANYGNGTVVLMRRSETYYTTINVGSHSLTYVKLRLVDHRVVNSGSCQIEKNAIEHLFKTL